LSTSNTQCDASAVRRYLDRQLSASAEAALESHLDHCASCRGLLDDSAAEGAWWNDASRFLARDEWDGDASQSYIDAVSSGADEQSRPAGESLLRRLSPWLAATDDPRMLGRFGGYEIAGVIGEGGMGVVLKGHEPALNRYIAIKVLAPHLAGNGAARQRFSREAQAAAAVLHENVIAIHRVDESQGLPFLVMPFIGGISLQKRIDQEGPLPVPAILRIARQIAAGLAAAHAQGLVHRDVKPANILLERGVDRVTLTDFGLARAVDDATLTRSGVIAGTPQYMSPEQARGEAIDCRSDLFSLGSVMYAMCAGRAPFRAETPYGILRRITDDEPRPIREINPDIPEWLEVLIRRLHAKSPAHRFQAPGEVADLLEQCLAHVQQPTIVPLPRIPFAAPSLVVPPSGGRASSGLGSTLHQRLRRILLALAIPTILIVIVFMNRPRPDGQQTSPLSPAKQDAPDSLGTGAEAWDDGVSGQMDEIGSALNRIDENLESDLSPETD
jgi:serine/threonine protein kinase